MPKEETRHGDLAARRRGDADQRVHGVLEDQQRLLDLLVEATATVIIGLPGFVSAKPPKSLDGARVATYSPGGEAERTSWAILENHEAAINMKEAAEIAEKFEQHLYGVSFVGEGPGSWRSRQDNKKRPPEKVPGAVPF